MTGESKSERKSDFDALSVGIAVSICLIPLVGPLSFYLAAAVTSAPLSAPIIILFPALFYGVLAAALATLGYRRVSKGIAIAGSVLGILWMLFILSIIYGLGS